VTGLYLATDFRSRPMPPSPNREAMATRLCRWSTPLAFRFLVYSTYLGGSQGEVAYGMPAIARATSYVTGYTLSPDFPPPPDAFEPNWGGGIDLFLTKLKPGIPGRAGLQSSTYIGGRGVYSPTALTLGRDGSIYVVGLGWQRPAEYPPMALQGYGGGRDRRLHHGAEQ